MGSKWAVFPTRWRYNFQHGSNPSCFAVRYIKRCEALWLAIRLPLKVLQTFSTEHRIVRYDFLKCFNQLNGMPTVAL